MNYLIYIIYISMINFYNSENDIINTAYEFPCEFIDVYIKGLKEGEILVSYNPSLLQNSNGLVIGIDSRFKKFYVLNKEKSIIKQLDLDWVSDCTTLQNVTKKMHVSKNYSYSYLLIIIVLVLIINLIRSKK